jgi:hypothetical protein
MISAFRDKHRMGALGRPDPCWFGASGRAQADGGADPRAARDHAAAPGEKQGQADLAGQRGS